VDEEENMIIFKPYFLINIWRIAIAIKKSGIHFAYFSKRKEKLLNKGCCVKPTFGVDIEYEN